MPRKPFAIFRRTPRPSAFVRNRPFLRSPVMARLDALFADPDRRPALYEAVLANPPRRLDDAYVSSIFDAYSPEDADGATSGHVREHVFGHILGPRSWWGARAAAWDGERLLAGGYVEAVRRAHALGDVPIKTFHLQSSADGNLQVNVLDAETNVIVVISTPPVPGKEVMIDIPIIKIPGNELRLPWQPDMPEVACVSLETIDALESQLHR
jgi:hypothetical protein